MLNRFFQGLKKFAQDEQGQATAEYVLLLTFVVIITTSLINVIITAIDTGVLRFGAQLERFLKTGRAPASVWIN